MSEKRRHPRVSWLVDGQVWCRDEDVYWDVRVTDISEGGCFVDTLVPLSEGSPVSLKANDLSGMPMDIPGRIVYGQPTIGSAIAFDTLDPNLRLQLQKIVAAGQTGS
mgnify:CR=1 FL=1